MAIASTVIEYLEARGVRYRTLVHQPEPTSSETAEAGLPVLLDERLLVQDPVYLEGGDRARLIEMSGSEFRKLMRGSDAGLPE